MKQAKRILSIALCTFLLLSLCGCGTTRNRETGSGYTTGTTSYQANNYAMYDYNEEAVAMEDYGGFAPAPMPAASVAATSAKAAAGGNGSDTEKDDTSSDLNPEKIIYSADATVETTE
ncbi:MAG: hypothetical protein IIY90_00675, partial [Oscillospiraceae bacterium]|nr:hypothetical protein [Oscillospiraceae bacterium]